MNDEIFHWLREVIYDYSGIALGPEKRALLVARVAKRMRALELEDHRAFVTLLKRDRTGRELDLLIDVISTNVTGFFRERRHFDVLTQVVGTWLAAGQRRLRFWSTACSTGEEPYSLAIALLERHDLTRVDLRILATDISSTTIEACKASLYTRRQLEGLSPVQVQRWFQSIGDPAEGLYRPVPELRNLITFTRLNLAGPPFPMRGPFDAVLCRNVMIYFDNRIRRALLAEIRRLLRPRGYLCVGCSEGISGLDSNLLVVEPSIFTNPEALTDGAST